MKAVLIGFWPLNLMVAAVGSSAEAEALFILLLILLVVIDTITKIMALSAQYVAKESEQEASYIKKKEMIAGLFGAFFTGEISSRGLITGFFRKVLLYGFLVYVALYLEALPPRVIFGLEVVNELADLIFMMLLLTELLSILENFRDMGSTKINQIQSGIYWLADKFTNGKFTASINYSGKREEEK